MADNNFNEDQNQDPFAHPIKRNNWWLYIFGGMVLAGIIIWFFIDWSYKDRNKNPDGIEVTDQLPEVKTPEPQETLPAVTVEGEEDGQEAGENTQTQQ